MPRPKKFFRLYILPLPPCIVLSFVHGRRPAPPTSPSLTFLSVSLGSSSTPCPPPGCAPVVGGVCLFFFFFFFFFLFCGVFFFFFFFFFTFFFCCPCPFPAPLQVAPVEHSFVALPPLQFFVYVTPGHPCSDQTTPLFLTVSTVFLIRGISKSRQHFLLHALSLTPSSRLISSWDRSSCPPCTLDPCVQNAKRLLPVFALYDVIYFSVFENLSMFLREFSFSLFVPEQNCLPTGESSLSSPR